MNILENEIAVKSEVFVAGNKYFILEAGSNIKYCENEYRTNLHFFLDYLRTGRSSFADLHKTEFTIEELDKKIITILQESNILI